MVTFTPTPAGPYNPGDTITKVVVTGSSQILTACRLAFVDADQADILQAAEVQTVDAFGVATFSGGISVPNPAQEAGASWQFLLYPDGGDLTGAEASDQYFSVNPLPSTLVSVEPDADNPGNLLLTFNVGDTSNGVAVERSDDGSTGWAEVNRTGDGPGDQTWSDGPFSSGTTKYYRIRSYANDEGANSGISVYSEYSDTLSATYAPPAVPDPTGFGVAAVRWDSATLQWGGAYVEAGVGNFATFLLERSVSGDFTDAVQNQLSGIDVMVSDDNYQYTDMGLAAGITYYYRITASYTGYTDSNTVGPISTTTLSLPSPPADPVLTSVSPLDGGAKIVWTEDNDPVPDGFTVLRAFNADLSDPTTAAETSAAGFLVSGDTYQWIDSDSTTGPRSYAILAFFNTSGDRINSNQSNIGTATVAGLSSVTSALVAADLV